MNINVDYEYLIQFKSTLERNAQHFDEIRQSIGSTINQITTSDWQDSRSQTFSDRFFSQSDPDIQRLVDTMLGFASYLQRKIEILIQYQGTSL